MSPWYVWPVCLLLLVAMYLASAGIVVWLHSRGRISVQTLNLMGETVYFPLNWIDTNTDFFTKNAIGRAYGSYLEWCEGL